MPRSLPPRINGSNKRNVPKESGAFGTIYQRTPATAPLAGLLSKYPEQITLFGVSQNQISTLWRNCQRV